VRNGHKVNLGTWYGLQGQPLPWSIQPKDDKPGSQVLVLPSIDGGRYDAESILPVYQHFKADCLITISDVWVFPPDKTAGTVFCPWLPIDHDPTPQPILEALRPAVYPMVYSKWGATVLAKDGIKARYIPGSAPADVFKPGDRQAARATINFPDANAFVVSMVSANKDPLDRKGFAEGLAGFARFAEKHEDAMLYLHTNWGGAIDIKSLVRRLGIEKRVIQPDPFGLAMGMLDDRYMALAYQASDVLLNPCKSEGFGLPLIEAQLCGIPIAATDFATTDELLFAGWKIQGQPDWSNGLNSWRVRVYIDSVVDALEEAYANRGNQNLARKARNGALRFDNDTVFNQYWRSALKDIEAIVSKARVAMASAGHSVPKIPAATNGRQQVIDAKIEALKKVEL
jgi:glycosyltransferase involved in cell wall biosynthesis